MPLEAPIPALAEQINTLNAATKHHSATAVLKRAFKDPLVGPITLVSSFGAESVVLLHMISLLDRSTPVLFLDTDLLFAETLEYQQRLASQFGLSDVRVIRAGEEALFNHDPDGLLRQFDPDACCNLRKTAPLKAALNGFDAWITGRKRFQGGGRQSLEFFEADEDHRIKINPLAHWQRGDVADYIDNNNLPRHPLVARGYPSIGCMPCTTPVHSGEGPRAGRWRDTEKTECGIHFIDGKMVRSKELTS